MLYGDDNAVTVTQNRLDTSRQDNEIISCPECGEPVWDLPFASKLAKCWNAELHASGMTLAFDDYGQDD